MAEDNLDELSREELIKRIGELEQRDPSVQESGEQGGEQEAPARKKSRVGDLLAVIRNVCISMIVAAAAVVLLVYFAFPVVRIYGSSMSSTLVDGDIVITRRTTELERGDVCAFYSGSKILCKRIIGLEGDVIEIDKEGTVYVNGGELDEPYLKGKSLGECNIEFPYTVPDDSYFVLGDNRRVSIDSRNTAVGCVSEEQVVGRLLFCVLPFPSFGKIR